MCAYPPKHCRLLSLPPPLSRKAFFEYDMPLRRLSANPLGEVLLYLRAKDVLLARC